MCCSRVAVLATMVSLLLVPASRADVVKTKFELGERPGVFVYARAPIKSALEQNGQGYPGVIRIKDTTTGATYINHTFAQYGLDGDVWFSTWSRDDVAVSLHVAPDGSYELTWWDLLTGQFYYYTGTDAQFEIRP